MTVTVNGTNREMCDVQNTKVDGLGWAVCRVTRQTHEASETPSLPGTGERPTGRGWGPWMPGAAGSLTA